MSNLYVLNSSDRNEMKLALFSSASFHSKWFSKNMVYSMVHAPSVTHNEED